jgi:hypothetical protein
VIQRTDFASVILAQAAPANTSVADLYSPATHKRAIVTMIVVANTTGSAANASVFAHASGNTKTAATALMYAKSIAANTVDVTLSFPDGLELDGDVDGTIGIQSGTNNAITYTLLGRLLDKI